MNQTIIIFIGSLEVGGTEKHLASIIPPLIDRGWNIQIITYIKKGIIGSELEGKQIPVENLVTYRIDSIIHKLPKFLKRILRFTAATFALSRKIRTLQEEKGNGIILHCFLPEPYLIGTIAVFLSKFSGFFIMSRRSLNCYHKKHPGTAFLERKFHKKTAFILGNSQAIINELKGEGVPEEKLKLIYNGVDLLRFTAIDPVNARLNLRKSLGIPEQSLVFIIVANLIPYKGHTDLLDALAEVKESLKNWHLIVVGRDDGILNTLREKSDNLGLSENIIWLGPRQDIVDLLYTADIAISASHEEGFSNVVLEGMAAGLPMIVTDVGGNKEAVEHEVTGLVVPAKNPGVLGQALLNLASDPNKREKLGRMAKKRVSELFSLQACVESYDKLYQSLTRY